MFQTASDDISEIAVALVAANKALSGLPRNRTVKVNGKSRGGRDFNYEFSYTTFECLIEHVRPVLTANGLWFAQYMVPPSSGTERFALATKLIHTSGQWLAGVSPLLDNDGTNQQFGSSLTYMRRYALSAMLGLAAEEDDDANAADGNEAKAVPAKAPVVRASNDNVSSAVAVKDWEPAKQITGVSGMAFCTALVGHIRSAASLIEIDAWTKLNEASLKELATTSPDLHTRLTAAVAAASTQHQPKLDQPKKTDAPDKTRPAKSAADDLDAYRKGLLGAKTEGELDNVWNAFTFGRDKRDQAVAMYDARRKTLLKAEPAKAA